MNHLLVLFVFGIIGYSVALKGPSTPEQIHIAVTDFADEMSVTWITPNDVNNARVLFGTNQNNLSESVLANPTNQHYYFLPLYASGAIHYATLQGKISEVAFAKL